ncbi:MAG: hypothetical protein K2H62_01945 [Bacteroidales bacterium]|nr:hypothetical protein [Bacteroidales bacterium]
MQNETFNEQDSLRVITEMIHKTKNEVIKKDFNAFLFYGYAVLFTSAVTYITIYLTGNPNFMMLWGIMFLPYFATLIQTFLGKKKRSGVVTYLQEMMDKVWKIIASMFGLTLLSLIGWSLYFGRLDFSLMVPLTIIYAGIGTSITGMLIKEDWLTYPPLIGLVIATYMFFDGQYDNSWNLLIGAAFLLFMIIPAHICRINKK